MITDSKTHSKITASFLNEWFINSVVVLLMAFALALGWWNLDHLTLVPPCDRFIGLNLQSLFWLVAGLFICVSLICMKVTSLALRLMLIVWLAIVCELYQLGLFWSGSNTFEACFGYVSPMYGLSSEILKSIVEATFLYLLAGGLAFSFHQWRENRRKQLMAKQVALGEILKISCPACSGHIAFSVNNVGQSIPCPHCQAKMTLRRSDNLKMSCFFCNGHIEFPVHALGTKMHCPHCNMDITLKEQT